MDEMGKALKRAASDLQQESGDTVQGLLPSDEVDRWADFDVAPEPDDTDLVFVGPLNMQSDRPSFSETLEKFLISDALQEMQSKHDATAIKVMQHAIRSANALASFAGYARYYLEFDPGLIKFIRHIGQQQRVSLIRRKQQAVSKDVKRGGHVPLKTSGVDPFGAILQLMDMIRVCLLRRLMVPLCLPLLSFAARYGSREPVLHQNRCSRKCNGRGSGKKSIKIRSRVRGRTRSY
eukprot:GHVU01135615.1.p1 GENE.GHVU01135615.1~~GHVU01135615.1.p1  ORF type:complete len:235 (+),score=15.63 GHVU01135615.1:370-1074(+)